jgi:hypothetical protein
MGKLYLLLLAFLMPALVDAQIVWDFSAATPASGIPAGVSVSAVTMPGLRPVWEPSGPIRPPISNGR